MFQAITTERLIVRNLGPEQLQDCHDMTGEVGWSNDQLTDDQNLEVRRRWLDWTVMSYEQLAALQQPPYGERGIFDRTSDQMVGLIGLVPLLAPFGRLASFGGQGSARFSPEVGLFWAVRPRFQRRGYASEAARAVVRFAFETLELKRICACTEYDNEASLGVMRRLGMSVERNPTADPPWFQITAHLASPRDL